MPLENDELIRITNLKVSFHLDEGLVQALDGIDISIKAGKVIGLVGESGCGKSITARSILRIIPPPGKITEGQILFKTKLGSPDGKEQIVDLAQLEEDSELLRQIRGGQISMIFQEPMTSFSAYHTVGDQISEAALVHQCTDKHEARQLNIEMLERVGIPNADTRIGQYPHEFSGGMRQRAMIAMAMICNPSLLIADEPTTSLDVTLQAQILELMRDLQNDYNSSVLFITHNLGVIAQIADEVGIMYMGKIVESGSVIDIFDNPKHPYTVNLLEAITKITRCQRIIKGVCETKLPSVTHIDKGHQVLCHLYNQGQ